MKALRNAGFVACLTGALVMLAGRFVAGVPVWLIWVGLAVIALGWAMFIVSSLRRPSAGSSNG
jgi:hypothetical protein